MKFNKLSWCLLLFAASTCFAQMYTASGSGSPTNRALGLDSFQNNPVVLEFYKGYLWIKVIS